MDEFLPSSFNSEIQNSKDDDSLMQQVHVLRFRTKNETPLENTFDTLNYV